MTSRPNYFLSVEGFLFAAISGAFIGAGYGLLQDTNNNGELLHSSLQRRTLGGSLLVSGLYLFSPSFLRGLWLNCYSME